MSPATQVAAHTAWAHAHGGARTGLLTRAASHPLRLLLQANASSRSRRGRRRTASRSPTMGGCGRGASPSRLSFYTGCRRRHQEGCLVERRRSTASPHAWRTVPPTTALRCALRPDETGLPNVCCRDSIRVRASMGSLGSLCGAHQVLGAPEQCQKSRRPCRQAACAALGS